METTPVIPVHTCIHIKTNGVICGSPALRNSPRCYYHHSHRRQLKRRAIRQNLRTPKGRAVALDRIVTAIHQNRIDPEMARSMLYAIFVGINIDA